MPDEPGRLYLVLAQPVHSKLVRNQLYTLAPEGRWVAMEAELPDEQHDPATSARGEVLDR